MADTGANCSMTANWSALKNVKKLVEPVTIGVAVTNDGVFSNSSMCTHYGDYPIKCDDGTIIFTKCFYNPNASDTIISPQSIVDSSITFHTWQQVGRRMGQPGQLNFIGTNDIKTITLQQNNGLYFCNAEMYEVVNETSATGAEFEMGDMPRCDKLDGRGFNKPKRAVKDPHRYKPTLKSKVLQSETWYLRMGGGAMKHNWKHCRNMQLESQRSLNGTHSDS
jgi:hypothetical protein